MPLTVIKPIVDSSWWSPFANDNDLIEEKTEEKYDIEFIIKISSLRYVWAWSNILF